MASGGSDKDFIVVIAVDNSIHSEYAFNYYATEVHQPNHKVHVVHCSEAWVHCHNLQDDPSADNVQDFKTKEEAKVEEVKQKFMQLMKEKSMDGQFKVVGGKETWHQIIDYQEQQGAQLIVIGTRGANVLRRTLLGSVSDSVVHHAHCPVLVCRHQ